MTQAEGGSFSSIISAASDRVRRGRETGGQTTDGTAGIRRLHESVGSPEGDSTCQGPRTGPHGMTVVAAAHDPLPVLLSDDLADVVAPHDDRSDRGATGVYAAASPGDGTIVLRPGITADLSAHVPAAPRSRAARVRVSI